jgi:hypothetical protein
MNNNEKINLDNTSDKSKETPPISNLFTIKLNVKKDDKFYETLKNMKNI